jgi:transposase-like protein
LLYYRYNHSHRDIEDLLAERGITEKRGLSPNIRVNEPS